ncbi:T9SS type A sorting domain-containing protein [Nonlabens ulvanivorans]
MTKKAFFLTLLLGLLSIVALAQERVFIDFGSTNEDLASREYINNISTSYQAGYSNGVLLYNHLGVTSGINLKVHDAWLNINLSGSLDPSYQVNVAQSASRDSFFGATSSFNGGTQVTGGFKLRQLDPNKFYSFSFFASRMNVTDNRETSYTVNGNTTQVVNLNASNNTTQKIEVYNMQPDSNGEIEITATAGANNTNSYGFYYLNALEIQIDNTPISQFITQQNLLLTYPIQQSIWEVGKTVPLSWNSEGIDQVTLEYSIDGGNTFNNIATVPATDRSYDFTVPNSISSNVIIRLSDGSQVIDSVPVTIIPDDNTVYRIIVLGSSTAAGSGPSNQYNAWVWKYRRYLEQIDTRYEVINLAQGGFVTYNILPTGTTIPAGVNKTINVDKNITKAVNLNAHGIIINLPSNDAAGNYPVTDQLHNYSLISQTASQNQIPLWVATPQPRNFPANGSQVAIQTQMVTETYNTFGTFAVDFWTGIGNTAGNQILPAYNSGDGVHATNEAHQIFYERLLLKDIHGTVKTQVDAALSIPDEQQIELALYPNPVKHLLFLESTSPISTVKIYNQLGQLVLENHHTVNMINLQDLQSGYYVAHIYINDKIYYRKVLKN